MSHTDHDNAYEDDDMDYSDSFHDDDDGFFDEDYDDSYDDSMDGDAESAFGSCGWGVDEYYNSDTDYGEDY